MTYVKKRVEQLGKMSYGYAPSLTNKALVVELERKLREALEDERKATMMYNDLAGTASMLGLDNMADRFRALSKQESEHFNILVDLEKSAQWKAKKETWTR